MANTVQHPLIWYIEASGPLCTCLLNFKTVSTFHQLSFYKCLRILVKGQNKTWTANCSNTTLTQSQHFRHKVIKSMSIRPYFRQRQFRVDRAVQNEITQHLFDKFVERKLVSEASDNPKKASSGHFMYLRKNFLAWLFSPPLTIFCFKIFNSPFANKLNELTNVIQLEFGALLLWLFFSIIKQSGAFQPNTSCSVIFRL